MADKKISELVAITDVVATDEYVLARSGTTNKITAANLKLGFSGALISSSTLGAPAANFDITSIPGTYSHLLLFFMGETSNAAAQIVQMTLNNDGGANYFYEDVNISATAVVAAEGVGPAAFIECGVLPPSTATSMAGSSMVIIPFYAGTTFHKTAIAVGGMGTTTGSAGTRIRDEWGRWANTAALTRITLTPAVGNWITGSSYTLHGF